MKLSVNLENCYGIKKLQHTFDFNNGNAFLIYAQNGSMKTSFAKVFKDISQSVSSQDILFPNRPTTCTIIDDAGSKLESEHIFVVNPYEEDFTSERIATLLVNKDLKREYELVHASIESAKMALFLNIGEMAGLKKNIEQEIAISFKKNVNDIYTLLDKLESTTNSKQYPEFADIAYHEIFNEKVENFLESPGIDTLLSEYIKKYNELIDNSMYFRKGIFNHNNANTISKSLKDNGFFIANHSLTLSDPKAGKKEISNQRDFDTVISAEKNRILNDPELTKRFDAIDKAIIKNVELRNFRLYLENNLKILPELGDLDKFRQKLWISYLFAHKESYENFLAVFRTGKKELARIVSIAKKQATLWHDVVATFNRRFSVPFILEITNQDDVILKDELPSLVFKYEDGPDKREIGRDELLSVLSTGEKRALYILNVIFEVRSREKENYQTLLILDDIADSFDYKNKFAIIEYIKDILDTNKFFCIILTHNFDFFRTVQSRISVSWDNCLMSIKTEKDVELTQAQYLKTPFMYWKTRLHKDNACLIAIIPMVRNLIEYTQGKTCPDYLKLTSLLHQKKDTSSITINDLAEIINKTLLTKLVGSKDIVESLIITEADLCLVKPESINLENKVVLSIAIRLYAEKIMVSKIGDVAFTDNIDKDQTRQLFEVYKTKFAQDIPGIILLNQVIMMTPEAIHLNSFMYEPLIDISDHHLKALYKEIKAIAKT